MSSRKRDRDEPSRANASNLSRSARTVITEGWRSDRSENDIKSLIISDIKTNRLRLNPPILILKLSHGKAALKYDTEADAEKAILRFNCVYDRYDIDGRFKCRV